MKFTLKNIFLALAMAVLAFGSLQEPAQAQEVKTLYKDTVSDSQIKTMYLYLNLKPGEQIDSATINMYAKGEIDIDAISIRKMWYTNGVYAYTGASVDSTVTTTNNAAGVITTQYVVGTVQTGFDGCNALEVKVYSASSGNDATDPNSLIIDGIIYRSSEKSVIIVPGS